LISVLYLQAQAWKRDRFDMIDHHYATFIAARPSEPLIHKAADLLFEIGHQCLKGRESESAVKTLSKATSLLDRMKDNCVIADATDLRFNVLHTHG
jgi:hypothetical protein